MHEHRTAGPLAGVACPATSAFRHQRMLLLELAVDPPEDGDTVAALAGTLGIAAEQVESAAAGLERAGLAERRGERLFATPPVLAVELLWPLGR